MVVIWTLYKIPCTVVGVCAGIFLDSCPTLHSGWNSLQVQENLSMTSKARTVRLYADLHGSRSLCTSLLFNLYTLQVFNQRNYPLYELSDPREIYLSQVSRALHRLARLHPTHTGRVEDSGFGSSSGVPGTTLRLLMRSPRPVLHLSHALRRDFFFRNL